MATVEICFDTSAINALSDDPEKVSITARIRGSHRALVTSVNIVEVVATPDSGRRRVLLETLRGLSDGSRPLVMPNKLVRRAIRAFAFPRKGFTAEIGDEDAAVWNLLTDPDAAGVAEQSSYLEWKEKLERDFTDSHRRARDGYQAMIEQNPTLRPRSFSHILKAYREQGADAVYATIKHVYKNEARRDLARDAMWRLLERVPHLLLYSAGWLHEIFHRAVRESHYSAKGKPGTLDLWCAVYLPHCDILVTRDRGQYKALRILNALSRRMPPTTTRTRVSTYNRFRREILA